MIKEKQIAFREPKIFQFPHDNLINPIFIIVVPNIIILPMSSLFCDLAKEDCPAPYVNYTMLPEMTMHSLGPVVRMFSIFTQIVPTNFSYASLFTTKEILSPVFVLLQISRKGSIGFQ